MRNPIRRRGRLLVLAVALLMLVPAAASATQPCGDPTATLLASGLAGSTGSGSTIGPDGALYVTEGAAGRISRIDRETGQVTTFADGLPAAIPAVGLGGPMDVAFIGDTAYALVTLVGPDVGGSDVSGIYRIDGRSSFTVIADIGSWSIANPPETEFFVPSGLQYAFEPYQGDFLVTDGHHNRVLRVALNGDVSEVVALDDVVPTGLDIRGSQVYLALAGPNPHLPEDGRVVRFNVHNPKVKPVASGARLLVDVEFGQGNSMYGLSQGHFTPGNPDGSPADPDSGALMRADHHGQFVPVFEGLDRPTSVEIVGHTAYVTTLGGEVWEIDNI